MRVGKFGSTHKVIAWILSAALVFSACPLSAKAEGTEDAIGVVSEEVVGEVELSEELISSSEETIEETQNETTTQAQEEKTTEETVENETTEDVESSLFDENGNVSKDNLISPVVEGKNVSFYYYGPDANSVNLAGEMNGWDKDATLMSKDEKTGVWSITIEADKDSYEYKYVVDGQWITDPLNSHMCANGNSVVYLTDDNKEVEYVYTIYYLDKEHDTTDSASLWIWTDGVDGKQYFFDSVEKLSDDNSWLKASVKLPFDSLHIIPRAHDNWDWQDSTKDFDNTDKKDVALYIINGESDIQTSLGEEEIASPVVKGKMVTFNYLAPDANSVNLAGEMNGWNKEATPMSKNEKTGVWSVTVEINQEQCEYKFVVNGNDWVTDPLNDKTRNGNSLVEVPAAHVDEKVGKYTYTIYYYDQMHQSTDSASLWIWTDGVNGKAYSFADAVELKDGNTWLKACVNADFEIVNIIPRAYDSWAWQDADKKFVNEAQDAEVELYIVNGDTKVYSTLPEIEQKEKRYVIVEYTRPAKDYTGWNIYSWNTGYGNEVTADFEEINGKMVAYLPVKDTKDMVSFCMRRSEAGNAWAEKDGGDHNVNIPLDQTIVKASFVQDMGISGHTPYNVGYETDVKNGTISFYYRDDKLYKDYNLEALEGKVKLAINDDVYEMEYDDVNERYVYTCKLKEGTYYYSYVVDGDYIADRYNEDACVIDGKSFSVFTYKKYDAIVEVTVTPEIIDYNDNAVIKLNVKADDESDIVVVDAYADLSSLGLSSKFAISPELLAGTIAVRRDIEAGVKEIPVTVVDQYGNIYTTTTSVEVVSRNVAGDFDWDEAVIYFAVTDRFFDGNANNNDPYQSGSYDPTMGSMYHGGDFAGLEAKLDYLKDLGVNTVWITPIVENSEKVSPADGDMNQLTTGYHGYWASNFTELNKHLGNEAEFKALIDALHSRGMKLMVDVVLNHAGYDTEELFNNTFIPGMNMLRDTTTTVSGDDKMDGLAGLPDFVTEKAEVRDLLVAWQTSWISKYDIDYYRVDTVKHVDDTTWKAFKNALTLVNPDFKMIGEYAGAGCFNNAGQLGTGQMDAILDFDFNDKAIEFVTGDISNVEKFMESRNAQINNTATLGGFLGSHDEDGLMWRLVNEKKMSSDKAYDLMKVAATLLITAKGQPIIYYGEELGQTGANNWPIQENRYDMDWSKANADNDMLAHYKKLLSIRNDNTAVFANGTRTTTLLDDEDKVIVVNRTNGNDTLYVGYNINQTEDKEVVITLKPNTEYTDLYNGTKYTTDKDGNVTVTIPAAKNGGTVVLKAAKSTATIIENIESNIFGESEDTYEDETPAVVITQPSFTTIDGKVVTGWESVVKEATNQAMDELVPLGDIVQSAIVDIFVRENDVKVIPANVVKEMVNSNATYRLHFMKNNRLLNVVIYTHESLQEVKGDLDLNCFSSDDKNFGEGFKSLVLDPRKKAIYGAKLSMAVSFGKENAGKPAYAFHRNLVTGEVELLQCQLLGTNGELVLHNMDNTDLIILY